MQPASTIFKKIPEILWYQVFKCFGIHEFVKLRLVNRKLSDYANHYAEIYERECLRIFTSNLPLFE